MKPWHHVAIAGAIVLFIGIALTVVVTAKAYPARSQPSQKRVEVAVVQAAPPKNPELAKPAFVLQRPVQDHWLVDLAANGPPFDGTIYLFGALEVPGSWSRSRYPYRWRFVEYKDGTQTTGRRADIVAEDWIDAALPLFVSRSEKEDYAVIGEFRVLPDRDTPDEYRLLSWRLFYSDVGWSDVQNLPQWKRKLDQIEFEQKLRRK